MEIIIRKREHLVNLFVTILTIPNDTEIALVFIPNKKKYTSND